MPQRAASYIDGFNLYHGIDNLGKPHPKWLPLMDYAKSVAEKNGEQLVKVHYFSALAFHKLPAFQDTKPICARLRAPASSTRSASSKENPGSA